MSSVLDVVLGVFSTFLFCHNYYLRKVTALLELYTLRFLFYSCILIHFCDTNMWNELHMKALFSKEESILFSDMNAIEYVFVM